MFEFKLQLGCLLIVIYYIVIYLRETTGKNRIKCNTTFDLILVVCPWAIAFDGITAWTVNHMDKVPLFVNDLFHCLFFVSVDIIIILTFYYMIDITIGVDSRKKRYIYLIPGIVSLLAIIGFMGQLEYIQGEKTLYSMGVSVVACFVSLILHYLFIAYVMIKHHKQIEQRKKMSIISYIVVSLILLSVQIIFPESLISALLPTLSLICIYENFENPYIRRLEHFSDEMVTGYATLVENRDDNTGGHIKRTKEYVKIIIKEMKKLPEYKEILSKDYVKNIVNAAPMHDIGKISTPDRILQKPGKLDEEEYEIMKKHAPVGGDIIKKTFADLNDADYLKVSYEVARHHHEKWNGKGYPDGLAGEDIPLHARIMAIADVFDAVSAKRCYRDAMPLDKCFKIIEEGKGKDFDPKLAELFLNAREKIIATQKKINGEG